MRSNALGVSAALLSMLLLAGPARANRIAIGGDYLVNHSAAHPTVLELTLAIEGRVSSGVSAEVRLGGLLLTPGPAGGVPLDFGIRFSAPGKPYFELLAGPWLFFSGEAVLGHAAFGLGFEGRDVSFGPEFGVLATGQGMFGAHLSFRL